MSDDLIGYLTQRLAGADRSAGSLRRAMGTVTQVSPLLVALDEDVSSGGQGARRLSSYTPALSDRVAVDVIDGVDRLVIGKPV